MNRKRNLYGVYSVVGLIMLVGIALGSDFLLTSLTHRSAETFSSPFVIFWSSSLITVLLAAASLLLFWFVLNRAPRNILVALIYLLTGLFIVMYPILYFTPALGGFFYQLPQLNDILVSHNSGTFSSGGLIAVTGLFTLLLPRRNG
jgi:predicted outer membrane repeat protein